MRARASNFVVNLVWALGSTRTHASSYEDAKNEISQVAEIRGCNLRLAAVASGCIQNDALHSTGPNKAQMLNSFLVSLS